MNPISRILIGMARRIDYAWIAVRTPNLRPEFRKLQFGGLGLQLLLDKFDFETVLDVGSGAGLHSEILVSRGKRVTALDYGESAYFRQCSGRIATIVGDFNDHDFEQSFDCIWCSHVLEHQLDAHRFLRKLHSVLKEGGVLAITVPPTKEEIVGGHVSLWNGGLLLYRLVLAGFDCSKASLLRYGYNITVILKKTSVNVLDKIEYDTGDIRKLRPYLPGSLNFRRTAMDDSYFGDIDKLNC